MRHQDDLRLKLSGGLLGRGKHPARRRRCGALAVCHQHVFDAELAQARGHRLDVFPDQQGRDRPEIRDGKTQTLADQLGGRRRELLARRLGDEQHP